MKLIFFHKKFSLLFVTTCIASLVVIYFSSLFLLIRSNALALLQSLWEDMEIVLIPNDAVQTDALKEVVEYLRRKADVRDARIITAEEGLKIVAEGSSFSGIPEDEDAGIFPDVIVVSPLLKYSGSYAELVAAARAMPEIKDVTYNDEKMEQLTYFANQFQFIHRGLIWLVIIFSVCAMFYSIRFVFLPSFGRYIGIIIAQGLTGIIGALLGWYVFTVHFYPAWHCIERLTSLKPFVVMTGLCSGWIVGLFVIGSCEPGYTGEILEKK